MSELQNLSRRELYNLVWRTPVETLAQEFGMSGRGLGKLCERHAIPVPPRGYWARKEAGQKVKRTPLIEISDSENSDPPIDLRIRARSDPNGSETEQNAPDPYVELYNRLLKEIGSVSVGKQLRNPHPLIAGWLKREESDARIARISTLGRSFYRPRFKSSLERRRLRILDALLKELENKGCTVSQTDEWKEALEIHLGRDSVEFTLSERVRQVRRRLTDEERAKRHNSDQEWTQTREPTNELVVKISTFAPKSLPQSWQDKEELPLEIQLHEITAGILAAIGHARSRREEQEEIRRQQITDAEEKQRQEAEIQAELDRKTGLRQRATSWRIATELRAYVSAVEDASADPADRETLKTWKEWALQHADEIDPIRNGSALETSNLHDPHGAKRKSESFQPQAFTKGDPDWFWGDRWWLKG